MGNDFFFRQGATHTVCQDYALSGRIAGMDKQYALVSDGCSGLPNPEVPGWPFTDFGSRFLVRAACQALHEVEVCNEDLLKETFPETRIITEARGMAKQAGLPIVALDATLVGAVEGEDMVGAFRYGDGVVAVRFRNGDIYYNTIKYKGNKPKYLRYDLDPRHMAIYLEDAQTAEGTENFKINGSWGHFSIKTSIDLTADFNTNLVFNKADVDTIIVGSDGLESFTQGIQNVPLESVLDQLFDIKSFGGVFLTRRCRAFLDTFCAKERWKHFDDFSVAGIHFE